MRNQNTKDFNTIIIGRNIRRWRELREMKGEDLARIIGLTKASLSNIENGKTDITINKLEEISKALNLSLQEILFSNPQSIVNSSQRFISSVNYDTQNSAIDSELVVELRRQLKVKDDQISFLQTQLTGLQRS